MAIDRDAKVALVAVADPEAGADPIAQVRCPLPKLDGAVLAERVKEVSPRVGCLNGVPLCLHQGDRSVGHASIAPTDRVGGVLPALVGKASAGQVDVLQQLITVRRAVVGEPVRSSA